MPRDKTAHAKSLLQYKLASWKNMRNLGPVDGS